MAVTTAVKSRGVSGDPVAEGKLELITSDSKATLHLSSFSKQHPKSQIIFLMQG